MTEEIEKDEERADPSDYLASFSAEVFQAEYYRTLIEVWPLMARGHAMPPTALTTPPHAAQPPAEWETKEQFARVCVATYIENFLRVMAPPPDPRLCGHVQISPAEDGPPSPLSKGLPVIDGLPADAHARMEAYMLSAEQSWQYWWKRASEAEKTCKARGNITYAGTGPTEFAKLMAFTEIQKAVREYREEIAVQGYCSDALSNVFSRITGILSRYERDTKEETTWKR